MEAIFEALFFGSDMRFSEACDLFERLKSREKAIKEYQSHEFQNERKKLLPRLFV
jgi:hypothetical protein